MKEKSVASVVLPTEETAVEPAAREDDVVRSLAETSRVADGSMLLIGPRSGSSGMDARHVLTGKCIEPFDLAHQGQCRVRFELEDGREAEAWLSYLEGTSLRKNQTVLIVKPDSAAPPIVVGGLADGSQAIAWPLPNDHKVILGRSSDGSGASFKLALPDGRIAFEIDVSRDVPILRMCSEDIALDVEGRLKISARSIDLVSRCGSVNVMANDDFKVVAERVRLN